MMGKNFFARQGLGPSHFPTLNLLLVSSVRLKNHGVFNMAFVYVSYTKLDKYTTVVVWKFKIFLEFSSRNLGKILTLTIFFQRGWNQPPSRIDWVQQLLSYTPED